MSNEATPDFRDPHVTVRLLDELKQQHEMTDAEFKRLHHSGDKAGISGHRNYAKNRVKQFLDSNNSTTARRLDHCARLLRNGSSWDEAIAAAITAVPFEKQPIGEGTTFAAHEDPAGEIDVDPFEDTDGDDAADAEELVGLEGEKRQRMVSHRHRERRLRDHKIAAARRAGGERLICEVPGCGFDFLERYGEIGRDYAHVHHLRPLAERAGNERTSLSELAVVCANCHAMIHVGGESRPLEGLVRTLR